MNNNWVLPEEIETFCNRFFKKDIFIKAFKLVQLSKTTISFSKGSVESYFITSGIVRDNRSYECKVVYKKRLEDSEEGPISSNCDCHLWTPETGCEHTASLCISFLLQKYLDNPEKMADAPPISINTTMGVTPEEYGRMIGGPHALIGSPPSATYSSMQYLLHNKKIINFPIPEKLKGKIIINLKSIELYNEEKSQIDTYPEMFYTLLQDDKVVSRITLFENLYLFNWDSGEVFHIPAEIKGFLHTIKVHHRSFNFNDIIRLFLDYQENDMLKLSIEGTDFESVQKEDLQFSVSLLPSKQSKLIEFNLAFSNHEDLVIPPPDILRELTFVGGSLGSFKKKKDAYVFITELVQSLEFDNTGYKKNLQLDRSKKKISDLIEFATKFEKNLYYHSPSKTIYQIDNSTVLLIIRNMRNFFSEMIYRFSKFNSETQVLTYEVSSSNLFEGLGKFYESLSVFGLKIFYDKNELSKWKSRIRFERKTSTTKWFDLTLNINKEDLEIIKKADLETGLVLTKAGLILLDKEQKELLRFMKKYVQYESEQTDKPEGVEELDDDFSQFSLPFNRARIFELFELKKLGIEGALTPEEEELCNKLTTLEEIPHYDLPEHLGSTLRPYQKAGYNWLNFLYENRLGACLADDMGLGKTVQTIAFIENVYKDVGKILIVCPVSLLLNWEKEFSKFAKVGVHIYHGGAREMDPEAKIILTSYGVMKKEAETTFSTMHFDLLVLDEVQHLKNVRSLGAFAARKIDANFRICLTGTPVENDLAEFYNILDLSIPGIWGDLRFIRTSSNKKSRLLARKSAKPFILRRTKDQVLTDLPPKIENNVYLNLSDEEQDKYQNSLTTIKKKITLSPSRRKYGEILKGLLELRQLCLWQGEVVSKHPSGIISSTKIDFLLETLEQIMEEGHQAIIFSQFTTYLNIIQSYFEKRLWKYARIDGSQNVKRRQKEVDIFQEGKAPLFLISLKAGGVGLNLTAASYVFMMDPWWNPAVESQAIDRAHRIGQKNKLTVYRPIIKGTVEEKVLELQRLKKELFSDLLPDDDPALFSGKLNMKDFEHLFE